MEAFSGGGGDKDGGDRDGGDRRGTYVNAQGRESPFAAQLSEHGDAVSIADTEVMDADADSDGAAPAAAGAAGAHHVPLAIIPHAFRSLPVVPERARCAPFLGSPTGPPREAGPGALVITYGAFHSPRVLSTGYTVFVPIRVWTGDEHAVYRGPFWRNVEWNNRELLDLGKRIAACADSDAAQRPPRAWEGGFVVLERSDPGDETVRHARLRGFTSGEAGERAIHTNRYIEEVIILGLEERWRMRAPRWEDAQRQAALAREQREMDLEQDPSFVYGGVDAVVRQVQRAHAARDPAAAAYERDIDGDARDDLLARFFARRTGNRLWLSATAFLNGMIE